RDGIGKVLICCLAHAFLRVAARNPYPPRKELLAEGVGVRLARSFVPTPCARHRQDFGAGCASCCSAMTCSRPVLASASPVVRAKRVVNVDIAVHVAAGWGATFPFANAR